MIKHENNIKNMIDKSGLKQTFIANRLGFHPADISHWISGRRYMNKVVCKELAGILRCKMHDLYPTLYKDKHVGDSLTIKNILDYLINNYDSGLANRRLMDVGISLDSEILDKKLYLLRAKMKGVE
jgi:predicted transcriptional regulator